MGKIRLAYIKEGDVSKYDGLMDIKILETVEDVATLLETFEETVHSINYKRIQRVMRDDEGHFFFIIGDNLDGRFDMYSYINTYFDDELNITPLNARLVFPTRLSRGVLEIDDKLEYDEDDIPTSFLDENVALEDLCKHILRYKKLGSEITLSEGDSVTIGRSAKRVDFLIKDNSNVGRVHCNVYVSDGNLVVHDFDSTNGTFVNNHKVNSGEDVQLVAGDILVLADEEFEVIK